ARGDHLHDALPARRDALRGLRLFGGRPHLGDQHRDHPRFGRSDPLVTKTLALLLLLPAAALAADRRLMVAPKAGISGPTSKLDATGFVGAEVGYLTPGFDDHLAVVLELNWMRPKTSGTIDDPRASGTYTVADSQLGVLV